MRKGDLFVGKMFGKKRIFIHNGCDGAGFGWGIPIDTMGPEEIWLGATPATAADMREAGFTCFGCWPCNEKGMYKVDGKYWYMPEKTSPLAEFYRKAEHTPMSSGQELKAWEETNMLINNQKKEDWTPVYYPWPPRIDNILHWRRLYDAYNPHEGLIESLYGKFISKPKPKKEDDMKETEGKVLAGAEVIKAWLDSEDKEIVFHHVGIGDETGNYDYIIESIRIKYVKGGAEKRLPEVCNLAPVRIVRDDPAKKRGEATISKAFIEREVCDPEWKQRALALFGDRDEIRVNEVIGAMRGVPLLDYGEIAEWLKENGLIEIGKKTQRYHPTGKSV